MLYSTCSSVRTASVVGVICILGKSDPALKFHDIQVMYSIS